MGSCAYPRGLGIAAALQSRYDISHTAAGLLHIIIHMGRPRAHMCHLCKWTGCKCRTDPLPRAEEVEGTQLGLAAVNLDRRGVFQSSGYTREEHTGPTNGRDLCQRHR